MWIGPEVIIQLQHTLVGHNMGHWGLPILLLCWGRGGCQMPVVCGMPGGGGGGC